MPGDAPRAVAAICHSGSRRARYGLGYKTHIAGDVYSDLPLAFIAASANDNEKKHAPGLLDKTVEATGGRVETLVTDSQYSSRRFREKVADCGVVAVIPYPSNQRKGEDVLRLLVRGGPWGFGSPPLTVVV